MKRIYAVTIILALVTTGARGQAETATDSVRNPYQPGDHELFIMPTAYTMDAGQAYFSDYELIFLNVTFAATSTTHIGAFFLFPVTTDFLETVTLGVKQNYFQSDQFSSALWGSYTIKNDLYNAGNVFSIGTRGRSIHLGIGVVGEAKKQRNALLFLVGGRLDLSKKISAIAEWTNAKELMDEDFSGLLSIGIRFRSGSIAWELAGVRPMESTGEFLFFPLLKATFVM